MVISGLVKHDVEHRSDGNTYDPKYPDHNHPIFVPLVVKIEISLEETEYEWNLDHEKQAFNALRDVGTKQNEKQIGTISQSIIVKDKVSYLVQENNTIAYVHEPLENSFLLLMESKLLFKIIFVHRA